MLELQALKVPELRRAPYLAELEIEKRRLTLITHADEADMPSARLAQSILKYYLRFERKLPLFLELCVDFLLGVSILNYGMAPWFNLGG